MKNLIFVFVGMGLGVAMGVYAQQFAASARGRKMRSDLSRAIRDKERAAEHLAEKARDRAARMGAKFADRVSQGAHQVAGKVDQMKEQLHSVVNE